MKKILVSNIAFCVVLIALSGSTSLLIYNGMFTADLSQAQEVAETTSTASISANYGTERENQDIIHEFMINELGIEAEKEYRLENGARVDILTESFAIEIDWAKKFHEGIGQSLEYAAHTGKKPMVILLARDDNWVRYFMRLNYTRATWLIKTRGHLWIDCWVFDARTKRWIVRGNMNERGN